ncbi:hypothetical protein PGTUg99_005956 [Puccinia graminis f. sp. tritici]|uniref:Uncharacterized protein n=1 Tax=Puccinia graminis f. sp. tritici TaxID=56615 RepID=A0A5B0S5X0_PUCGR|nr:hypothetical protein PGTUg99_005956 [Puccinia graminis f. sp. tritici]
MFCLRRSTTTTTRSIWDDTRRLARRRTFTSTTTARSSSIPGWIKDLEKKQGSLSRPSQPKLTIINNRQKELEDQIIIYQASMKDDFSGSPNRIGISIIGLLITSGLVANQIRHHGAGPVWSDSKSDWLDFELKLWDQSTRMAISIGLITFSFIKSLKFLFTLTHTIKRITIPKDHLTHLKRLISSTRKRNKPLSEAQLSSLRLTFYSIGSLDLIGPLRRLFGFSVHAGIPLSHLLRLSRPLEEQTQAFHQRALWLKFSFSNPNPPPPPPPQPHPRPPQKNTPPRPADHPQLGLDLAQLNSFALQVPAVGLWGNAKFDLSPSDILALFEEKIKSIDDVTTLTRQPTNNQSQRTTDQAYLSGAQEGLLYTLFGLDFRHSIGFNLSVLKAHLSSYYHRLSSKALSRNL